jgi:tRNA pseudouridine55 synthase
MSLPRGGLLIIDKPAGKTSHDCVQFLRQKLNVPRIGHCGTLDPFAQGVLPLLLGPATCIQDQFLRFPKTYWFEAEFGQATESGDRDGRTFVRLPFDVAAATLARALRAFEGEQWQVPPRISAVKHRGKRFYEWTRQGIDVSRAPRQVTVEEFTLIHFSAPLWEARVRCSRGTYIRTLAEDVAAHFGTVAVLQQLVREQVGPFSRDSAISWTDLHQLSAKALLEQSEHELDSYARHI